MLQKPILYTFKQRSKDVSLRLQKIRWITRKKPASDQRFLHIKPTFLGIPQQQKSLHHGQLSIGFSLEFNLKKAFFTFLSVTRKPTQSQQNIGVFRLKIFYYFF